MASKFYAVKKGRKPGIYLTWPEAQKQISGFSGAQFKSFPSKEEALNFINPPEETQIDWSASDTIEAYVDGSFDRINNRYSYGVVIVKNDQIVTTFNQAAADPRYTESFQIAGEVFGALAAIRWAIQAGYAAINIRYDYLGIEQWARGLWKTNKPVSKDYVQAFKELAPNITVRFQKEKAHTGVTYNEMADQLAKQALNK